MTQSAMTRALLSEVNTLSNREILEENWACDFQVVEENDSVKV